MTRFKITFQTEETAKFFAMNFKGDEDYENTTTYEDFADNVAVICFKDEYAEEAEMMIWGYATHCGIDSQIVSVEEL